MTIQEQITQFENTRAAKVGQRDALIEKSGAEGTTLDTTQQEQFDSLNTEIRSIDEHLVRLGEVQKDMEKRATAVVAANPQIASQSRSGVAVVRTGEKSTERGIGVARHIMALAMCNGNRREAADYVKQAFPAGDITDAVVAGLTTRAAVAPGTTTNATYAAPLVVTQYMNDFLELLRPKTIIGRLPGLKRVPFNASLPIQTAGGTFGWVGQSSLKPVTNLQLSNVALGFAKASAIYVISEELARMSTPSAQELVRDEAIASLTTYLDTQFIDPTVAAVANVNPASISNGVAGTAASGTAELNVRQDIRALVNGFNTGNYGLASIVLLMGEGMAFTIGTIVNAVGQPTFPNLTAQGGTMYGIPVVTSNILTTDIYAIHTPSILVADESGIEIDVSRETSLIMDSAPNAVTQAGGAAPVYTSMFQANLVAIRAERYITWAKARSTAVRRINTAAYV